MIFYFSGTGNSLYAARTIAESLGEDIQYIPGYLKDNPMEISIKKDQILGFVFPVYYYSLPTLVEEFVKNLKLSLEDGARVFVLATCGATTGDSTKMLKDMLLEKGVETDFVFALEMPDNYVLMYDVQSREQQERILGKARESLVEIIEALREGRMGDYNTIKGPLPGMMTSLAGALYKKGRRTSKFHSTDRCTGCNLCERICPVDAIKMVEGRPVWTKDRCVHCLACIHRCPEAAIQYGRKTEKRGRYINPLSGL